MGKGEITHFEQSIPLITQFAKWSAVKESYVVYINKMFNPNQHIEALWIIFIFLSKLF